MSATRIWPPTRHFFELRGFSLFGGVRVTTSPNAPWSGPDQAGETVAPLVEASQPVLDVPSPAAELSATEVPAPAAEATLPA